MFLASKRLEEFKVINDELGFYYLVFQEHGYSFTTTAEWVIVMDVKEKLAAYIALEYEHKLEIAETSSTIEQSYELSNGQVITIGVAHFCGPKIWKGRNDEVFNGKVKEGIMISKKAVGEWLEFKEARIAQ
ncbi:hypothetical protein ACH5RR_033894 [Cinchona calisaya]|uniref:Uncharacterized protein n=1 Tax=Cinchona calisaya TaxID=153742 RepID=A0ABD2YAM9_9GENT